MRSHLKAERAVPHATAHFKAARFSVEVEFMRPGPSLDRQLSFRVLPQQQHKRTPANGAVE